MLGGFNGYSSKLHTIDIIPGTKEVMLRYA